MLAWSVSLILTVYSYYGYYIEKKFVQQFYFYGFLFLWLAASISVIKIIWMPTDLFFLVGRILSVSFGVLGFSLVMYGWKKEKVRDK
jgi:hypothetical protein